MEYRIQYLRDRQARPVGCIAIKTKKLPKTKTSKKGNTLVTYQVSVHNPSEEFQWPLARQLSLGRLVECPLKTTIVGAAPSMHVITAAVMQSILDSSYMPHRARQAAKLWLRTKTKSATK